MASTTILLAVLGLVLLVLGAEVLVRGASRLAAMAGVSPLVVGLTVVAFGTSAPEMAVSVKSAWLGQADLAVGNVVGSNIFNILFILGVSALIAPLVVAQQLVRRDVPIMIALSLLVLALGWDGQVSRMEGVVLCAGLVAYTVWLVRASRKETSAVRLEYEAEYAPPKKRTWPLDLLFVLGGLGLLVLGSRWLVSGAVDLAQWLGVSEVVVGLTVVAAGTSLPEVATSVIATLRGERDIAVGNVIGSNIFNLMGVLGVSAAVSPAGLEVADSMMAFDIPVMTAAAVACLPIFVSGYKIARWEGAVFFLYYAAYTLYLVLNVTQHDALHGYSRVMLWFVLPLTVLTLAVVGWRSLRQPVPRS